METVTIEILEPKARKLLDDLESMKLIKVQRKKSQQKPTRQFGSMKGLVVEIADDFDEPLKDLEHFDPFDAARPCPASCYTSVSSS